MKFFFLLLYGFKVGEIEFNIEIYKNELNDPLMVLLKSHFLKILWSEDWGRVKLARLSCDVKNRARRLFCYCVYANMSSSASSESSSSDTNCSTDEVYNSQFRPYEDEPLVHNSEDLLNENSEEQQEEACDEDGLTPAILEARFDRKVNFDSW